MSLKFIHVFVFCVRVCFCPFIFLLLVGKALNAFSSVKLCHLNQLWSPPRVLIQPLWCLCGAPSRPAGLETEYISSKLSVVCGMLRCTSGSTLTSPWVLICIELSCCTAERLQEVQQHWQRSALLSQALSALNALKTHLQSLLTANMLLRIQLTATVNAVSYLFLILWCRGDWLCKVKQYILEILKSKIKKVVPLVLSPPVQTHQNEWMNE